ncbi:MAG: transposase, partial [Polyangiaceae bacterium]
ATPYRAYLMKESFATILGRRQPHVVRRKLAEWTSRAMHSGLNSFAKVARTVRQHLEGIVAYVATGLSRRIFAQVGVSTKAGEGQSHGQDRYGLD